MHRFAREGQLSDIRRGAGADTYRDLRAGLWKARQPWTHDTCVRARRACTLIELRDRRNDSVCPFSAGEREVPQNSEGSASAAGRSCAKCRRRLRRAGEQTGRLPHAECGLCHESSGRRGKLCTSPTPQRPCRRYQTPAADIFLLLGQFHPLRFGTGSTSVTTRSRQLPCNRTSCGTSRTAACTPSSDNRSDNINKRQREAFPLCLFTGSSSSTSSTVAQQLLPAPASSPPLPRGCSFCS